MNMNGDNIGGSIGRVVLGVAIAVTAAIIIGTAGMMVSHESRISVMESNRFTDQDARDMERRLLSQLPPQWMIQRLDAIDTRLQRMEERLQNIGDGQ